MKNSPFEPLSSISKDPSFLDRLAASPAAFQIAAGALVASGIWAVAVAFLGGL